MSADTPDAPSKTRHEIDSEQSVATQFVEAIAAFNDTDPQEMDPLYDDVDLDAIDDLVADDSPVEVIVRTRGAHATISSDWIVVTPAGGFTE